MFFQGNEKYNCATYLRLSRSDGDQQESNSIKNQRALLNDYMGKHPELHKFDEYVDDGYSGTNFERPDFKRMMSEVATLHVPYKKTLITSALKDSDFKVQTMTTAGAYHYKLD